MNKFSASPGKTLRWNRFTYPGSKHGIIVPIDHGLTIGPVAGLESADRIARWIDHNAITGIIAHKGMVERLASRGHLGRCGVMVHVNGMSSISSRPDTKLMLTSMESAARLGADGISLQINFDGTNDDHNLTLLGSAVDRAQRYGLPVLTMLYDKVKLHEEDAQIERLRHLMRIGIELGTDAIKIAAPEKLEHIPRILEHLCEDAAIFFAGGALSTDDSIYRLACAGVEHGAAGLCVGRNVFQKPEPGPVLSKLRSTLLGAELFSETEVLKGVRHGISR